MVCRLDPKTEPTDLNFVIECDSATESMLLMKEIDQHFKQKEIGWTAEPYKYKGKDILVRPHESTIEVHKILAIDFGLRRR